MWPTICSSAPHGGPPARPPPINCTLFHTGIRSGTALALHVAVLGSAVPSPATPPAPCLRKQPQRPAAGSIPAQADAGRGLLHARALLPAQVLQKVRCPYCHCILLPWLQLCLDHLTPFSHVVWCCSLFMHSLQVLAFCFTALRHAGAFQKSKNRKWPLNGVSGLRPSAGPFDVIMCVCMNHD